MSFARRLRFMRKENRLTQAQAAQKLRTTAEMIRKLENGSVKPSKHILKRCADAFGLKTDFFVREDDDTGTDLAAELKEAKREIEKGSKAAEEEEIERKTKELTRRVAPSDAIGATIRIKMSEEQKKKEKEREKKAKERGLAKDDFSFDSFGGSSSKEVVQEEDPDLLTHIPELSAGLPPLISEVEKDEREPGARRKGKFLDSADGEPASLEEFTKIIKKSKEPEQKPQTLDQMVHELIRRQNALVRLLIEKKVISKKDFRQKLK